MTGVVEGFEWSPLCVVGVRLMSGEWMDGGDLWSLIPLSCHSFHSSITLILFTFHSIHSLSLSFSLFLSLYPVNTHSHSIPLYHSYSMLSFTTYTLSISLSWWWLRCELFHLFTHSLFILIYHCHFIHPFDNHMSSFTSYTFHFITHILMSYHFIHLSHFIITSFITWLSLTRLSCHSCSLSIPFYHSISFFSLSYTPYYPSFYTLSTQHSRFYPFTIYTIHSTLSSQFIYILFNTLYCTLFNRLSLNTHSHYPSITLIYYSYSISFSILYYSSLSLHLFILFIQSYHHDHLALSHTLYTSLYQSFYFGISLSLFYIHSFHIVHL